MSNFSRPAYDRMLSLRVTTEQDQQLTEHARRLGLAGKADVLREALDYWLAHSPRAREKAETKGKPRTPEGSSDGQ